MSLLMKALQQAAQNRGEKPAGEPEPESAASPASGQSRSRPPLPPSAPALGELSLEPLAGEPALRPRAPQAPAPGVAAGRSAAEAATPDPARAAPASATGGQEHGRGRIQGSPARHRNNPAALPDDLQFDDAPDVAPGRSSAAGRRTSAGAPASPQLAGAVLSAGSGSTRAGWLDRVSRVQWIVGSGLFAGLLLGGYFYLQIEYPGLFTRGFSRPLLTSPVSAVPPPATRGPVSPPPPAQITGVPAAPSASAGQPAPPATDTPPGVPSALASSPLLNPQSGQASAAVPGVPGVPGAASGSIAGAETPMQAAAPALPAPPARATTATASAAPPARPRSAAPSTGDDPAAGPGIRITRGTTTTPVNPILTEAYEHLQSGRLDAAQRLYQQLADADPRNVDALFGLAALAQLGNRNEAATGLYFRVLEVEPRNTHAQASLIGLIGRADPGAAESQLKQLITRDPSALLFFTLGNLYADQNRWPLAQQAFFQAHHLQPNNADYAFNLAVGLERIAQPRLALNYLRVAVKLADAGSRSSFDLAAARKRISLLEAGRDAP